MIYGTICSGRGARRGQQPAPCHGAAGERGHRRDPTGTGAPVPSPGVLVLRGCWGINKSHFWGCCMEQSCPPGCGQPTNCILVVASLVAHMGLSPHLPALG